MEATKAVIDAIIAYIKIAIAEIEKIIASIEIGKPNYTNPEYFPPER